MLEEGRAFLLLVAANATPVIVARFSARQAEPIDFRYALADGERLFGDHKTWRGLFVGVAACALTAAAVGLPSWLGARFGAVSLLADMLSSAVKRRLRLKPGTETLGLDQLGEALLPLLVFREPLSLNAWQIAAVSLAFILVDVATARLRHRR